MRERVDVLEGNDSKEGDDEHRTGEKREREPGNTPEFQKKQQSKIAVPTTLSTGGAGSKTSSVGLPKPLMK